MSEGRTGDWGWAEVLEGRRASWGWAEVLEGRRGGWGWAEVLKVEEGRRNAREVELGSTQQEDKHSAAGIEVAQNKTELEKFVPAVASSPSCVAFQSAALAPAASAPSACLALVHFQ